MSTVKRLGVLMTPKPSTPVSIAAPRRVPQSRRRMRVGTRATRTLCETSPWACRGDCWQPARPAPPCCQVETRVGARATPVCASLRSVETGLKAKHGRRRHAEPDRRPPAGAGGAHVGSMRPAAGQAFRTSTQGVEGGGLDPAQGQCQPGSGATGRRTGCGIRRTDRLQSITTRTTRHGSGRSRATCAGPLTPLFQWTCWQVAASLSTQPLRSTQAQSPFTSHVPPRYRPRLVP